MSLHIQPFLHSPFCGPPAPGPGGPAGPPPGPGPPVLRRSTSCEPCRNIIAAPLTTQLRDALSAALPFSCKKLSCCCHLITMKFFHHGVDLGTAAGAGLGGGHDLVSGSTHWQWHAVALCVRQGCTPLSMCAQPRGKPVCD